MYESSMTSPLLLNGASGEVGPARARLAKDIVNRMYLILAVGIVVSGCSMSIVDGEIDEMIRGV